MSEKLKELLKSRKFWLLIIGLLILLANTFFGLSVGDATIDNIVNLIMVFMGSLGVIDAAKEIKKVNP